ncbi:MAG TPA: YbdD/YjiX family protein [Pseudonocardiaceae bacterium]
MNLRQVVEGIRWYLREVSGEGDYDRYVAHARRHQSDAPVLSRRDFERRRTKEREATPGARCC